MKSESKWLILLLFAVIVINKQQLIGQVNCELNNIEVRSKDRVAAKLNKQQIGLSLRSNRLNVNYKKQINKNYILRTSLGLPTIWLRKINNFNFGSLRNLSLALGVERGLIEQSWFRIYAGSEVRAAIDYCYPVVLSTFFIHAIAGLAIKLSDNILAFAELQPGLKILERNFFSDISVNSFRANNIGVMVLL